MAGVVLSGLVPVNFVSYLHIFFIIYENCSLVTDLKLCDFLSLKKKEVIHS